MIPLLEDRKLYITIIVFTFVTVSLITLAVTYNHYQKVVKDTIHENRLLANLLASLIYEHEKAAISILESYAQQPTVINAVSKKDLNQVIPHLEALQKRYSENDAPFITDQYGTLWANYPVDKSGFGKNLAFRNWYKGVSKNWKPYVSSVYRMIVHEKGLAVALSVPVFDRQNKVIGILSAAQRIAFLKAFIKEKEIEPEKAITLLDQEGNIIFSNDIAYEKEITKYPDIIIREMAVAGIIDDLEIEGNNNKGNISYVSMQGVKELGWSVIVGHRKHDVLKSLYDYFFISSIAAILIICVVSLSVVYFRKENIHRKAKELLASEERYRTLFDQYLDGICLAVPDTGIILDCNPAMAALVSRDRTELIGQSQTILHPIQEINLSLSPTFKQHLAGQEGQILETQIITSTGIIREVEIKANLINLQGKKVLQGIFRDITERKQAYEVLRKSEEKYRNLFDNAMEGVYRSTLDGRLIDVNTAFCKMFGYESPDEAIILVTDIGSQMYAEHDARQKVVSTFKEKGIIKNYEVQMRRKDGSIFWAMIDGRLAKADDDSSLLEGFVLDITERKEAEEALQKMNEDLVRSNKDLEQFAYVASHDLQEPLRMVSSFTQLLAQRYHDKLDQDANDFISYAVDGANRMQKLIQDLLAFSRVTTRANPLTSVDLHDVLGEALANLSSKINENVAIVSTGELPTVNADRTQLVMIFQNLIDNAIKFHKASEPPRIYVSAEKKENEWIISVRDNGIGIEKQYFDRIFNIFQRLHSQKEYSGTGIGLALCKRIIGRHGGKIWVESVQNEGSIFKFTLKA